MPLHFEPTHLFFLFLMAGMLMVVFIVGIVSWRKAREKELQFHQDLRIREMDHERRMKELELELEKARTGRQTANAA